MLNRMDDSTGERPSLDQAKRFHFLYQKVSADLGRLSTFASEPELRRFLESLVARGYGEIHETREKGCRWNLVDWFFIRFPQVFRRHAWAFHLSVAITMFGVALGGLAMVLDDEAKEAIVGPGFAHLLKNPVDRVREEEQAAKDSGSDRHASFAGFLMTHNTTVSIKAMALGMSWGVGTILVLISNGIQLGLVVVDYVMAGQTVFLLGWLMPHGVIEIPSILIAGQAGFILAQAIIGRGSRRDLAQRLRAVRGDVATLIGGVAVMLVWAGIVESFLSQHHQPVLPYWLKIAFGSAELILLVWFLNWAGARAVHDEKGGGSE